MLGKLSHKLDDSGICLTLLIFIMGVYAIISGLVGGYTDLYAFDTQWVAIIDNIGLTNMYINDAVVNYPPIYMMLLWLIHKPLVFFFNFISAPSDFPFIYWFIFKSVDILPLYLGAIWVYKKISPKMAVIFMFSLSVFSNAALFGQRDAGLCVLIIVFLYYMKEYKYLQMCVVFAFMCLYKTQAAIFLLPLIGFAVYAIIHKRLNVKQIVTGLFAGGFVGYLFWLPFVITSKDLLYPLYRYLGFTNTHYTISHGGVNIWFIYDSFFNVNGYTYSGDEIFATINGVITIFICIVYLYFLFRCDNKYNAPISLFVAMTIWCLFSMNQHDRFYIYPMTILLSLIFIYNIRSPLFKYIYVGFDLLAGLMVTFGYFKGWYMLCGISDVKSVFDDVFTVYDDSDISFILIFLFVLVGIYIFTTYKCIQFIVSPTKHIETVEQTNIVKTSGFKILNVCLISVFVIAIASIGIANMNQLKISDKSVAGYYKVHNPVTDENEYLCNTGYMWCYLHNDGWLGGSEVSMMKTLFDDPGLKHTDLESYRTTFDEVLKEHPKAIRCDERYLVSN